MRSLSGKRYWLVGASEGLGAALAQRMSAAGAHVILSARSEARLTAVASNSFWSLQLRTGRCDRYGQCARGGQKNRVG